MMRSEVYSYHLGVLPKVSIAPCQGEKLRPYVLGESAYVVLDGELDLSRKSELIAALPDPKTLKHAVINLTHATYLDSFMLGALVQFRTNFISGGGDPNNLMIVLPEQGVLRRTFEITGLHKLFPVAYAQPEPVGVETGTV
jgi:anti-anti-sigma factor